VTDRKPPTTERDGAITTDVVTDAAGLAALAPEWQEVQSACRHRHVLADPRFVGTWWQAYGADKTLSVLALRRHGDLVGVVPLVYSRGLEALPSRGKHVRIADDYRHLPGTRWRRVVPVRRLSFPLNFASSGIRYHCLLRDDEPELYDALFAHAIATRRRWDLMCLDGIPEGSEQQRALLAAAARHGLSVGLARHVRGFLSARLPATMDEFLGARSRSFRRWLKRMERESIERTRDLGDLTIREFRGDAIDEGMRLMFALELESWKTGRMRRRALHLALSDVDRDFHLTAARAFAADDEAQVLVTFVGDRPVNALYCLEREGMSSGVLTYRAEAFSDRVTIAPLWRRFFELAIARGLTEVDFNGNNDYLARFADGERQCARHTFYHGGAYASLLRATSDTATRAARVGARWRGGIAD